MYEANRQSSSCLYTEHMIYSPDVPVFRDDDDVLLDEPYAVSIVTAPAVNAGVVRAKEPRNVARIEPVMRARIERVLALAVVNGHDVLVLGAWGCGVFGNDPTQVAERVRPTPDRRGPVPLGVPQGGLRRPGPNAWPVGDRTI